MLLLGCAGEAEIEGEAEAEAESEGMQEDEPANQLQCDMPKLFEQRCGGSICHGSGESTAAGLDLTSPGAEQRVSGALGTSCEGILADPAHPETSLLYTKLLDAPTCGARMPLNGEPLDVNELACMRDWISGLLPPIADEGCEGCLCEPRPDRGLLLRAGGYRRRWRLRQWRAHVSNERHGLERV